MTDDIPVVRCAEDVDALPADTKVIKGDDVRDRDLEGVRRLADLTTAYLDGCTLLGDDALAHLAAAPKLTELYITGDRITDEGLRAVGRMANLEEFGLDAPVTGEGFRYLAEAKRIREIHLPMMRKLDGKHLAAFAALPALRTLCLYNVPTMVDPWLDAIGKIEDLKSLILVKCPGVTERGLAKLREARASLQVVVD